MKKFHKPKNLMLMIWFLAVILFLSATNASWFTSIVKPELQGINLENAKSRTDSWDMKFRAYFHYKEKLLDICGLSYLILNKKTADNFQFVKDQYNTMQFTEPNWNAAHAIESITVLNDRFAERGIPLVYAVFPPRFNADDFPLSHEVDFNGQRDENIMNETEKAGVNVLDIGRILGVSEQIVFKTDLHMKTETEFRAAKVLSSKLMDMGLDFKNFDEIYDPANYTIVSHPFMGNLSRSTGKYFTLGIDDFEIYYPGFPTNFTLINPSAHLEKHGDFTKTLMNGYEDDLEENPMPYWVLNYLQYPSPYYRISNHNIEDGCSLLFIMDSYTMRAATFLALGAKEITVVDPRGEGGNEILKTLMAEGDFDAVIVTFSGSDLYNAIDFSQPVQAAPQADQ
ncbi:MAG: hypothetical protein LBN36_04015 [Clostridiales Family XIII bacterium]|jgi:hypothetical protein|nr:hypothetical protein [Clostridiales Family XIII bacterium]